VFWSAVDTRRYPTRCPVSELGVPVSAGRVPVSVVAAESVAVLVI
jgi:hypothetical protein